MADVDESHQDVESTQIVDSECCKQSKNSEKSDGGESGRQETHSTEDTRSGVAKEISSSSERTTLASGDVSSNTGEMREPPSKSTAMCEAREDGQKAPRIILDGRPAPDGVSSKSTLPRPLSVSKLVSFTSCKPIYRAYDGASGPATKLAEEGKSETRLTAGSSVSYSYSHVQYGDVSVYYGFGNAYTDFLVALGLLLMSALVTGLIILHGKVTLLLFCYIVCKIITFIIGYIAARKASKSLYILTIILVAITMVGAVYFAARAIVGIVDHPSSATFADFLIYVIEVAVLIHLIYFCVKLM